MAKVLIVEDDEFFAHALRAVIEGDEHTVSIAQNGKAAVSLLENEKFDLILTDLQMPQMNGIQLAAWVRENTKTPLIMMTGFAETIDTAKALECGAVNLIFKPFNDEEVSQAIKHAIENHHEPQTPESKYTRVPSSILVQGGVAEFNLYRKSEGKLSKLVSRGEIFDPLLSRLQSSSELYTEKENLSKILPLGTMVAKAAAKSTKISAQRRTQIVEDMVAIMYSRIESLGLDHETLSGPVDVLKCLTSSISDDSVWVLLDSLEREGHLLFAHTVAVTALSLLVAMKRNLGASDQFKIASAGLLHDIGETKLDAKLTQTPIPLLTVGERVQLQDHVKMGVEMLRQSQAAPEEICEIILQHHEDSHGRGYPRKLHENQIHPLAKILRAVDEFTVAVIKAPGARVQDPMHALHALQDANTGLDLVTLRDLVQIFSAGKGKASA